MTALVQSLARLGPRRIDGAWLAAGLLVAAVALLDRAQLAPTLRFALDALVSTAPYIAFAVLLLASLRASGADGLVAEAFKGREVRMVAVAALVGGLAPFCSCEVIPFIAGLLAMGAPLSAVMAFWLASPLIDPASLLITAGALGWTFALAKAGLAVALGLFGGYAMMAALRAGGFSEPLRPQPRRGCGCGASPLTGRPVWRFWREPVRRGTFAAEALANAHFLLKWLALAYLIEALMIAYVPAETIAGLVGGAGLWPVVLSALVGAPAYLNAYAAPPLVSGLMAQGMTAGAAMAFMVAGAVSSIPAMTAVFALVRPGVFAAYVGLGLVGAVLSGLAYGLIAG
ncbi:permease [Aquibium sp. A9E412]|uniref:permease n=1 Tax=Aquibium sp. A9E412 TaxID=2976767 RepID=UPI0025AF2677|nr:permease [Aquibium sp. A9E412]MDN2565184.1 permease [Aquibium sp. A9E412]